MRRIGMALSGGGHRATVFSLGALLYLVDCGRNKDVRTITSVSGGSLTNAYLSLLDKPFNELTSDEFRRYAAQFAKQIAGRPSMFFFSWAVYLLFWVGVWLLPAPQPGNPFWSRLPIPVALTFPWAFLIGALSRGTLWGWWGTWLYVGLLAPGVVAIPAAWWLLEWYWPLLIIAAVLLALSRRHIVAGMAFGATIRSQSANARRHLAQSPKHRVRHIFCSTELHVGRHLFLSRDFVYTKDFGLGVPGSLRVRDAAQLSANFPGGFPFRRLRAGTFRFASASDRSKWLVFTDGGVYDNTATAWYLEPENIFQMRQQQKLDKLMREAMGKPKNVQTLTSDLLATPQETVQSMLDELEDKSYDLIAVNAAYPPSIQRANLVSLPVLSDILTFTKTTETLYNNDNHQRLRDLRHLFLTKEVEGALISIEEHPEQLATYISDPQRWFSGQLPVEESVLAGEEANFQSRWVHEVLSFYARSEHPHDSTIPVEVTGRAREALERLHPGYRSDMALSAQESDLLQELPVEIERLEEELKVREGALNKDPHSLARAQEELELYRDIEIPLSKARSALMKLSAEINVRRYKATAKILPFRMTLDHIRQKNQRVATTLQPLGAKRTADLLYQGYLGAMMNLHVLMEGYPLMPFPKLEDFTEMILEKQPSRTGSNRTGSASRPE